MGIYYDPLYIYEDETGDDLSGEHCALPFVYEDVTYDRCIDIDGTYSCVTETGALMTCHSSCMVDNPRPVTKETLSLEHDLEANIKEIYFDRTARDHLVRFTTPAEDFDQNAYILFNENGFLG